MEQFKKEMAVEGQHFVVVPQSNRPLDSDYPELKDAGVMKCTRAHLSFAQELMRRGDECAVVAEDDATFALSAYWPLSLKDLCSRMFQQDPNWTTLTLYSSDRNVPKEGSIEIRKYTEGTWGTVSYLATKRWAEIVMRLSHNNTRLMKSEIGSRYGSSDSSMYAFKGSSGYVLRPSYVFPNNVRVGSIVHNGTKSSIERNNIHLSVGVTIAKNSFGHFVKHL